MIAAPVGPVGLLCIRRTLQKGVKIGLATGFGAAISDAFFGFVSVLGVSVVMEFIHNHEASIRLIGGLIVLASAWHTWFDHPKQPHQPEFVAKVFKNAHERRASRRKKALLDMVRALLSGLVITMTNPLTLFGTFAVVATFGAVTQKVEADVLILGIFSGSAFWWFLLAGGVSFLRRHFTESRIVVVNRLTAIALAALAVWAFVSGIHGYLA